ncbi:zinc finger BED domain-containing protein RICESLEEPER 2-like protein [Tanacetum coccineum]
MLSMHSYLHIISFVYLAVQTSSLGSIKFPWQYKLYADMQDGIRVSDKSIENIRYAVKWIKKLGNRIEKFKRCAEISKCDIIKNLILDVPTRWNSTYNMLEVAQAYEEAFDRYDLEDVNFGNALRKKGFPGQGKCSNLDDTTTTPPPTRDRLRDKMKTSSTSTSTISELDKYLGESVEEFDSNVKFDILAWWKVNIPRFPIVSLMARDLLAIPVSTVAFESVFSTVHL